MQAYVEARVREVGEYIVSCRSTIRSTAKVFGVSKSTIEKDVQRLKIINPQMLNRVQEVLDYNWSQKHIRGGIVTKTKRKMAKEAI